MEADKGPIPREFKILFRSFELEKQTVFHQFKTKFKVCYFDCFFYPQIAEQCSV